MNTQPFSGIQPLWSSFPSGTNTLEKIGAGQQSVFADIFKNAIENVKTTGAQADEAQYLLATGQLDNPAELTIANTKAELSVNLLVQLRNKALDAYSEISRINL